MPLSNLRTKLLCGVCALALALGGCQSAPNGNELAAQGEDAKLFGQLAGALAGILIGSQIGKGTGRLVAVAGGALLGAWLGSKIARDLTRGDREQMGNATDRALEEPSGSEVITWKNPRSGNSGEVTASSPYVSESPANGAARVALPEIIDTNVHLDPQDGVFLTQTETAARVSPSFAARQTIAFAPGAEVEVVGKVSGANWYLASRDDSAIGYIPGMDLVLLGADGKALGSNARQGRPRVCRNFTQMITLANGNTDSVQGTACRAPDGTWEYLDP